MPSPLRGNHRHTAKWCVKYTRNTGVNMSVAICPHCAAVQRQPAEAGSVVQCEACHKSFTVGESVNPAVTQPPVSAPAAPVKHIPTGYGGGILIRHGLAVCCSRHLYHAFQHWSPIWDGNTGLFLWCRYAAGWHDDSATGADLPGGHA